MDINEGNSPSPILPEVIIFQILKDLPVKTLLRFRAVSKLWCSIIDDPVFVDCHRTRSYTRTGGIGILCQYRPNQTLKVYSIDPEGEGSPVPFFTFPAYILDCWRYDHDYCEQYRDFVGLQSVNGLIYRKYCIWNPSTRESIDLPPIRINIASQFDVREANMEKCYIFPTNLLGFDSVSKQYKVVNMCDISFGKSRRAEYRILTLGQDSYWRNLESVPEKLSFITGSGVCCIDDVILCSGWVDNTGVIVAFEVGPEEFRVIPLPDGAKASSMGSYIIQVGGRLGFVNVSYVMAGEVDVDPMTNVKVLESLGYVEAPRDVDQAINDDGDHDYADGVEVMNIWILEDYHKLQWKKEMLTFPSTLKVKHYGSTSIFTTPMGSIHTREILLCSEVESQNCDVIYVCSYYDLESKSLRMVPKLTAFPEDCGKNPSFNFTKQVECLFRLKAT